MHEHIRDIMITDVCTMDENRSLHEASQMMKDRNIGDVICTSNGRPIGIVTDRDIVVRAVSEGKDPEQVKLGEVCTRQLVTIAPDANTEDAVNLMRQKAIRRLPVVENDQVVGIVSLGDLAVDREPRSVLGSVSAAPPNN